MQDGKRHRWPWVTVALFLSCSTAVYLASDWLVAQFLIHHMEDADRIDRLQTDRVMGVLDLQPGQRVADIGAGTGLFSRKFSTLVGTEGTVFAIDINRNLLEHIQENNAAFGVENIRTVLATPDDPRIPQPVDLIFICDTLHHIDDRAAYLGNLRNYLLPEGRIAVLDFKKDRPPFHSLWYSTKDLDRWMREGGYVRLSGHDFLDSEFFLLYGISRQERKDRAIDHSQPLRPPSDQP